MSKITVIIPHFNGVDILKDCLHSLYKNIFLDFETVLIDNGSMDGSPNFVRENFSQVMVIENEKNLGYAGACNQGMLLSKSEFILLLNNDTVMPENFLMEMLNAINDDPNIAMVQPKIKSIQDKEYFDYSGAAGGEMDIFGYPFARGRIFDFVEKDKGQYDNTENRVFWTSGCAILIRKSVIDKIGLLDDDFFAHQEEIDLNWRAQLAGYRNVVTCKTYILHYSGYTLKSDNSRKMYLNHRNNLILMIKNYSFSSLIVLFPIRLILEGLAFFVYLFQDGAKRSLAIAKSINYLFFHSFFIWKKRKVIQKLRTISDREIKKNMFPGSIVLNHFIRKLSPVQSIKKFRQG